MADCTYTVPDKDVSGDNLYGPRSCYQPFIDWAWPSYKFDYDWWQDGWGYDDCCNTDKPLARTFNGLWALTYSAEDYRSDSYSLPMLNWASRFVREQMNGYVLRADCGNKVAQTFGAGCTEYRETVKYGCKQYRDDGYNACDRWDRNCCDWWPCSWGCKLITWLCMAWYWVSNLVCVAWGYIASWACTAGTIFSTKRIVLYNTPFFYGAQKDAAGRASTFVHECRHISGKAHNADFPAGSSYGAGSSGADSSWDYDGAWRWQVVWLWWYYAAGARTTPTLRAKARDDANVILTGAFATNPGFTIA
jgi:hypothetical protein